MIKAVIFDCFGVLTGDLWKEFVASLPEDQQDTARDLNRALDSGVLTHTEFYRHISALTGHKPQRVEDIITSPMQKNRALLDYIKELSVRYKIGLLSNISSDWITREFLSAGEVKLFDAMVFSYQIGITKPDGRAFMAVAENLMVQPHECIMIDDSKINCQGAEKVGMKAILYMDSATLKTNLKSILK